ncbi:MAG TPA: hypothetical protein VFN03_12340 [Trueperaceae bacterium]|nr:hypothetical protein [Trueperaceae bacterium]
MIQRFAALMVVAGLGTGAVLRIVAGRGRFATFVAVAHLPVLYHVVVTVFAGLRAGVEPLPIGLYAIGSLVLMAAGVYLGRRMTARRPWWAAFMPAATLAAYLLLAVLPFGYALRGTGAGFDTVPLFGAVLATIFTVSALVPFAPPPVTGPRLPRFPWQR